MIELFLVEASWYATNPYHRTTPVKSPKAKKNVEEKHSAKRFTPAQPTDQPLFYMRKIWFNFRSKI